MGTGNGRVTGLRVQYFCGHRRSGLRCMCVYFPLAKVKTYEGLSSVSLSVLTPVSLMVSVMKCWAKGCAREIKRHLMATVVLKRKDLYLLHGMTFVLS